MNKAITAHLRPANSDATFPSSPSAAFSVAEFCRRYSIGRSSAYEEHRRGRLTFRKVGARSIILASEAERWAASLPETKA